jgi:hypothetical protein
MNTKIGKIVSGLLIATLLLGMTAIFKADAQPLPYISIEPDFKEYGPGSCVGQEFSLVIWGHDFDTTGKKIAGFEVHVLIDMLPGYLEDATPGFTNFIGTPGGLFEGVNPGDILYGIPMGWYGTKGVNRTFKFACAYGAGWTPTAAFKLAEIRLKIVKQPEGLLGEPDVDVPVALSFTDVSDDVPAPIDHERRTDWGTWKGAKVTIHAKPVTYPPKPLIEVKPPVYSASALNEEFDITIQITECDSLWDVAGFDITLLYNPTLLSVVSVTEGNFLKQHGELTWGWIDTATPGRVWAVFVKLENPTPSSGTDSLIIIRFKAIYESTVFPPDSCPLELYDTHLASWPHPERPFEPWGGRPYAVELPYCHPQYGHHTVNGLYISPLKLLGPNIDVFTQYPDPYGGQGPDQHSDMFAPQEDVILCAWVSYNNDGVQNKWVTFEIFNALGERIYLAGQFTNATGYACIVFRIPMPCDPLGGDPPEIFGEWHAVATVSLDEVTVTDTIDWRVDWRLRILSVEAIGDPFNKYTDKMVFKVTFESYAEQGVTGLIVVTPVDEQQYPIGYAYEWVHLVATRNPDCTTTPDTGEIIVEIPIPKYTRIGVCTVYANALTDWPYLGGTALCPTKSDTFGITA